MLLEPHEKRKDGKVNDQEKMGIMLAVKEVSREINVFHLSLHDLFPFLASS